MCSAKRSRAGRIDPLGPVALDQTDDADGGPEALLWVRPRALDHRDETGRVRTDAGGFTPDALATGLVPEGARLALQLQREAFI